MDQEINTPQSQKYSYSNCNSDFRYKKGGYIRKEPKEWKSAVRSFITVNDIWKLTTASKFILKK
jgi:hypothetical protein